MFINVVIEINTEVTKGEHNHEKSCLQFKFKTVKFSSSIKVNNHCKP